jgi:hypothetical protein
MTGTTKQAAPQLCPPYRVIAGRGIVDASNRAIATVHARRVLNERGYVTQSNELADTAPGLSPTEADALAHELVRVLNSHTRIAESLQWFVEFCDEHEQWTDVSLCNGRDDSAEAVWLREARAAVAGEPETLDTYTALMDARHLLTDIRDYWAGGDCPADLWARIEAATGGSNG